MKIQPVYSNILIKPVEAETTTLSGIVIPDSFKEKPQIGEIISVGDGFQSDDGRESRIRFKEGQKVLYKKWGGNEVKVDGKEMLLVEQKDILAVVFEDDKS